MDQYTSENIKVNAPKKFFKSFASVLVFLHLLELSHSMLFYVIKFYSLMFNTHVNFIGCISLLEVLVDDVLVDVADGDHVGHPGVRDPVDHGAVPA